MTIDELKDLRQAKQEKINEARDKYDELIAKSERTDEENTEMAAIEGRVKSLKSDIDGLHQREKDELAKPAATVDPTPTVEDRTDKKPVYEIRGRYPRLKAFKDTVEGRQDAHKAGMYFKALIGKDEKARQWCEAHTEMRVMQGGIATTGGAFVPDSFENTLIRLVEEFGVFRANTRVLPLGSGTTWIPRRTSGVTVTFPDEITETTESTPGTDNVQMIAQEASALVVVPNSLLQDSAIGLADFIATEMALGFATKEDACGFTGDGTNTFGGMQGINSKIIDGTHTAGVIDAVSGNDQFGELDLLDFENMIGQLPRFPGLRPAWYISQVGWAASMQRLANAAGGNTVTNIVDGVPQFSFLGIPVVISQTMPTVLTALNNLVMVLLGDLTMSSTLGDRMGIEVRSSEHAFFTKRQTAFLGVERFQINNHDLGDNTNAGPMVALIGNT